MRNLLTCFFVAGSCLTFAVSSLAQSNDPAWLDEIKDQAAQVEACEVTYFLNINETELGGRLIHEARIQCADGRMFDATRQEPSEVFEFKTCEIQVC